MTSKTFKSGQKVRDRFGRVWTVVEHRDDCRVYVAGQFAHIHPSNLYAI